MSINGNDWEQLFSAFDQKLPIGEPAEQSDEKPDYSQSVSSTSSSIPTSFTEQQQLTSEDLAKLGIQLMKAIEAAKPLSERAHRMVNCHENIRLPKGLRTTSSLLQDLNDVLIATKALIELYLEIGIEPLYQAIDDSRLKTAINNTTRTLSAHVPTIQEGLNDVEKAMTEGYDRPSANLRIRIVKGQAKVINTLALQQAQALAQTMEAFPLENGSLQLLCLFEEKGNETIMAAIDHALSLGGAVEVPVANAPTMLEAVLCNDQKAVDTIIAKRLLTPNS